ncbi:MAG: hypothetical protein IJE05_03295 [Clostridia bacterium]|nr:hypothetical protein [Clostridia bacterium]
MRENINYDKNKNYWITFIKPFNNTVSMNEISEFQQKCYMQNVFGMGWNYCDNNKFLDIQKKAKEFIKLNKDKNKIRELYKKFFNKSADSALRDFLNIEIGDYVITRLLDGNYYIGKVSEKAEPCNIEFISRFSWYCKVEEWKKFNKNNLPGHIIGRMSQRRHSTIQRIATNSDDNAIIKHFIYNLYHNTMKKSYIKINLDNFTSTLSSIDLEDLVYAYIIEKHKDYVLYPSQCKKNEIKYEFDLVNKTDTNKHITCQVKNKNIVKYNDYLNDAKDKNKFEKIYLFSGLKGDGYGCIDEKDNKIIPIARNELYEFLISKESDNVVLNILKEKLKIFYLF